MNRDFLNFFVFIDSLNQGKFLIAQIYFTGANIFIFSSLLKVFWIPFIRFMAFDVKNFLSTALNITITYMHYFFIHFDSQNSPYHICLYKAEMAFLFIAIDIFVIRKENIYKSWVWFHLCYFKVRIICFIINTNLCF